MAAHSTAPCVETASVERPLEAPVDFYGRNHVDFCAVVEHAGWTPFAVVQLAPRAACLRRTLAAQGRITRSRPGFPAAVSHVPDTMRRTFFIISDLT